MATIVSHHCRRALVPLVSSTSTWLSLSSRNYFSSSPRAGFSSSKATSDSKPHTSNSATVKSKSSPEGELQPLSRPLGVTEKPAIRHQTKLERLKEVLTNDEAIAEQRKHLVKEAVTKGYFHDLNATRRHGGKTWIAPKVLIREDRSLYFPDIVGKSLADGSERHTTSMCMGKISVITILSTKISEIHAASFTTPTLARFASHPLFNHLQINLQLNALKSILVSLFLSSLRRTIPPEQHPFYLVSSQNIEYQRDAIGLANDRVGYVYLVDENLRIRWAGCADATADEARALEVCTGMLVTRLDKRKREMKEKGKKLLEELQQDRASER
ncbi:F1F0 ATP synthase assembly protein Atp10 [Lentinula aciculospora]|uniref:F1F0 ATP synthase assembly protein Atp10 n=1 Tax=Lentinula aciculospora TaxID=153920 RepID=A0A9W9DJ48_9AGAR|nr:F1F0 ATP synthase assembly protein Atp10 [Lentinula aciculospora]